MKKIIFLLGLALSFIFLSGQILPVEAASFQFDPNTGSISSGESLRIKLNINPGSDQLSAAQAYILYDPKYLKVESVEAGSYFPTVSHDTATEGKVFVAGMVDDPSNSVSGEGTLATIVFQGKGDGVVTLIIDCDNSKIVKNDIDATNVMDCSQNGQARLTVGSGTANSSGGQSQGSESSRSSGQPTPSVLPKSGIFENMLPFAISGAVLFLLGSVTRLFLNI